MNINVKGELLRLLSEKGIFWPEKSILILSDLHLGKAGHFRKHGIPIPLQIHHHDLQRVDELISLHKPERVIFLGDLFHSDLNAEWWNFISWIKNYPAITFLLVKGNHDILPDGLFEEANIEVVHALKIAPFSFTHIREDIRGFYNLSGHIHPGVRLLGAGKQGLTLPCFQFTSNYGLLPAFGNFTGIAKIKPSKKDRIYVIANDAVLNVSDLSK